MTDRISMEQRSWNMSRIPNKDTKPEIAVRKSLWHSGLRYRLNVVSLPGRPDVVFPIARLVVFVHGCFWHRHSGCKFSATPKSNSSFWKKKFAENVSRDNKNLLKLKEMGWNALIIWECQIENSNIFPKLITRIIKTYGNSLYKYERLRSSSAQRNKIPSGARQDKDKRKDRRK